MADKMLISCFGENCPRDVWGCLPNPEKSDNIVICDNCLDFPCPDSVTKKSVTSLFCPKCTERLTTFVQKIKSTGEFPANFTIG